MAERNGKKVEVWGGAEPFDAAGRAALPFWTKRLVMSRRYDKGRDSYTVEAMLSEDGTGGDWLDPTSAPAAARASAPAPAAGR